MLHWPPLTRSSRAKALQQSALAAPCFAASKADDDPPQNASLHCMIAQLFCVSFITCAITFFCLRATRTLPHASRSLRGTAVPTGRAGLAAATLWVPLMLHDASDHFDSGAELPVAAETTCLQGSEQPLSSAPPQPHASWWQSFGGSAERLLTVIAVLC